jgi:hypothetical protein
MEMPVKQSFIALRLLEASPVALSVNVLKKAGVAPETLRRMVEAGSLIRPTSGYYALDGRIDVVDLDWVAFSLQEPDGIIGLLTAAVHHGITQEVPAFMQAFVPRTRPCSFRLGGDSGAMVDVVSSRNSRVFSQGIETVVKSGHPIKITSKERTLLDLFLFSPFCSRTTQRSARIPEETFLDALSRCEEDDDFSFKTFHELAGDFGCDDQITPLTKTSRFTAARSPGM